jgi:hypothetical protein
MGCGGFNELPSPLPAARLSNYCELIRQVFDDLAQQHRGRLYLPFAFYRPTELRAAQAYLTTFPRALVEHLPELRGVWRAEVGHNPAAGQPARRSTGTPRTQDPVLRAAIERYAVILAKQHYKHQGAAEIVELGAPYDLLVRGLGPDRHIEVKGSSVSLSAVELTTNEVAHARNYAHTDLVVVDGVQWTKANGEYQLSGGRLQVWCDWTPAQEHLSPTKYRYELPASPS